MRKNQIKPPKINKKLSSDASHLEGITIVKTVKDAKRVVAQLQQLTNVYHACDTETTEIDLDTQGPVGNGSVICASIFCGPEFDFGNGPKIWIGLNSFFKFILLILMNNNVLFICYYFS